MPRIIYEGKKTKTSSNLLSNNPEIYWNISIKNVGLGAAVIDSYYFKLVPDDDYSYEFSDIVKVLKDHFLIYERDYYLANITKGYTIPAKESLCIFELALKKSEKIKCLDFKITFKGFLGERYSKEVYCIPRQGINNVTTIELIN